MIFDYVDIGTSDFDTNAGKGWVLLVEPLFEYLANIPDYNFTFKANFAISDHSGYETLYHLKPTDQFPEWVRGCNSLGKRHVTVDKLLKQNNLSPDLMLETEVRVITFKQLVELYGITGIVQLKIDTEGHEYHVLSSVLETLPQLRIGLIKFEYIPDFGDLKPVDDLITRFQDYGYKVNYGPEDVTLVS